MKLLKKTLTVQKRDDEQRQRQHLRDVHVPSRFRRSLCLCECPLNLDEMSLTPTLCSFFFFFFFKFRVLQTHARSRIPDN